MNLTPAQEKFAQLVAKGANQTEAYRQVTGSKAKAIHVRASEWGRKVAVRIAELQEAAKTKATAKYVYEYEDAMREADQALTMAKGKDDAKACATIIGLKAKLSGLETEARKNERPPFEGQSDDELVEAMNRDLTEAGYTIQ